MAKLKGYGIVFNDTMRNKNISVKAKAVYAYLSSCAGAKNFCFPSRDLICNHLGICQSTLTPLIRELENEGVLRCEKKRTRKGKFNCCPSVLTIVPISSEQNRPCAIAPSASMPYRFAEKTMFFFLRNAFTGNTSILTIHVSCHMHSQLYSVQSSCQEMI